MISLHLAHRVPAAVTLAVASAVLLGSAAGVGSPSRADAGPDTRGPSRVTAAPAPAPRDCLTPGDRTAGAAQARLTRAGDQRQYTDRQLRRIDRRLHRRLERRLGERSGALLGRFGLVLRIPVHAHVVDGNGSSGPSRKRVQRQIAVLNRAYSGGESRRNTPTRFRFYLDSYERVHDQRWHTASMFSRLDRQLRRALHVGGPAELNLYFAAPVDDRANSVVLGWSSVPWKARRKPLLDGVTIHQASLPGGRLRGYNRGDTTVHEVGHWLGLFHTFEGGCSPRNDRVADTPAEASPSTGCRPGRDTCDLPGRDPVHNFMDYSFDPCMYMFTPGQVSRMTDNWLAYRTP